MQLHAASLLVASAKSNIIDVAERPPIPHTAFLSLYAAHLR